GQPADASVPRHLRAAPVAHPARARHRDHTPVRPDRPRHFDQRTAGSTVTRTGIRRARWFVAAAAVALSLHVATAQQPIRAPPPPPPPPPGGQQPFRAGVDLVSLNVTVTDGTARYVTDLTAEDFNVFEDGVKQDVTFFNRTNLPIALALLLDTSAS